MLGSQVVHETIDGETVLINLATGSYYSLEGTAADLWSRLLAGEATADTAATLAAEHNGDAAAIEGTIAAFHQHLFEHGLIIAAPVPMPVSDSADLGTFQAPELHVYTDLREHLLADPVHDVDRETGWPAVAPER
ncbi:PqqD family protein [Mycobacterium sp. shizuoka-1]|uniref:PqqD family protein n=1 Tax=Mycobacterium sp. shizuoka-1 TaxID=2039281 RepID=UPI001303F816|nr:PqqD family protein [Mycobacterium sp. shizuoka-1]